MSRDGLFARLWGRGRRGESPADNPVDMLLDGGEPGAGPPVQVEPVGWGPGAVIAGLYKVGERLGAGGMGVVHRVRHLGWGQDLAVKSPRPDLWAGTDGIEEFLDEAKVWVNLAPHPHICTCHYVRVLDGVPRIFAEYIEGSSLAGALRAGHYGSLADVLDVSIQMAWGLQAAHEAGVVHQDVKPANVLLTVDGTAKITDFGLARAQARAEARTGIPELHGEGSDVSILVTRRGMTPAYASPEQVAGQPLGRRSDVWSWAVSVLELFVGQVSWRAGSATGEALEAYLAQGPAAGRAAMPQAVARLLRECFTVDPAGRPAGMRVVAERLVTAYEVQVGTPYPRQVPEAVEYRADGLNNKALSLLDLGEVEQAERCWEQALQADPRHADATYNWGLVRWRTARIIDQELVDQLEAVRAAHAAAGVADGCPEYLLGSVHLERGDIDAAAQILGEAARHAPTDPEIMTAHKAATTIQQTKSLQPLTLTGHTTPVSSVAVTLDGRRALSSGGQGNTGEEDTSVRWWDLENGRCLRTLTGHTRLVGSVAVTPDGSHALSSGGDGTVRWWDLDSGRCLRTLTDQYGSVVLMPDGRHFLTCFCYTVRWWDVENGRCLRTFTWDMDFFRSMAVMSDARHAVSGSQDGTVRWWDLDSGRCLRTLTGHTEWVSSVAVTSDGRHALSGGQDGVRWWDLEHGRCLRALNHTSPVSSVAVTPDGRHALSGGHDGRVRWWDLGSGRCLRTFTGHISAVSSVAVTPDGRHALSGGYDGTVRWWGLVAESEAGWRYSRPRAVIDITAQAAQFRSRVDEARLLLDCHDIAGAAAALRKARTIPGFRRHPELHDLWRRVGSHGQRTTFLDANHIRTLTGHTKSVESVAVTPDGRHALSGSRDGTVRWWDLGRGRCLRILNPGGMVHSVAVTPDGRHAVSGGGAGVVLWDLRSGRCLHTHLGSVGSTCHSGHINSVAVTPDGRHALSGGGVEMLWWDLKDGRCLRTLTGDTGLVHSVAVTPDGRHALSGSQDGTVRWWDLDSGRCLRTLTGHTKRANLVAVTPDGRHALFGSGDTVQLWDPGSGRCLRTLTGHTRAVSSVAVTPDGRHALFGSGDTVQLWDLGSGRCLRILTGHTRAVSSVAVMPDGRHALSGGWDGIIRFWEIDWDYEFPD